MAQITDIADEVLHELEEPSDLTLAAVAYFLKNNIGRLNSLTNNSYGVTTALEITPELGGSEKAVLKKMFFVHWYRLKSRSYLYAAGTATVIEVTSDGGSVRMVNKTTIAKDYMQMAREEQQDLDKLVAAYKIDKAAPLQVHGDDHISAQPEDFSDDVVQGRE